MSTVCNTTRQALPVHHATKRWNSGTAVLNAVTIHPLHTVSEACTNVVVCVLAFLHSYTMVTAQPAILNACWLTPTSAMLGAAPGAHTLHRFHIAAQQSSHAGRPSTVAKAAPGLHSTSSTLDSAMLTLLEVATHLDPMAAMRCPAALIAALCGETTMHK